MAKILLVDDDKGATGLMETIVQATGYEAIVENDSSKALDVAKKVQPDLILLDLMMVPPTGFQLCRMLRATSGFRFTPIIIVTALDDEDSKLVAFGAGANDYVTKPFHVGDLMEHIRDFLDDDDLLPLNAPTSQPIDLFIKPSPQSVQSSSNVQSKSNMVSRFILIAYFYFLRLLRENILWFLLVILMIAFFTLIVILR